MENGRRLMMQMKNETMKTGFFFLFVLIFSGCYYDHADEIYPSAACNPTAATYALDVAEIMNRNSCNSCHNSSLASGNVRTDTYNDLRVVAENGKLWGALNHMTGYVPMPQGANKISQCDLNKIKKWLDSGVPQ